MKIVSYGPYGVTTGIIPWNGPLAIGMLKAAASLAAGDCFVCKPSEKTPFATLAWGKLIVEVGFPPGISRSSPATGPQVRYLQSI